MAADGGPGLARKLKSHSVRRLQEAEDYGQWVDRTEFCWRN